MIPPDQIDTPEKRARWEALFRRYRLHRRWAIQEFLKIRTKDQRLVLMRINEAQDGLFKIVERQEKQRRPDRVIVVKPRKVGISTGIQALFFHRATSKVLQKGYTVAHDQESTEELFTMSDLFFNEMPYQMRPMTRYFSRDQIVFENPDEDGRRVKPGLRSQLKIGTAGKIDLGRSKDIHLLHCSELPFWPDAESTELSLLNAVPMIPSTMVFKESTPAGVGNKFHRDYLDAKAGRSAFEPFFMAWHEFKEYTMPLTMSREEFEDTIDETEAAERKAYNLTLEQLNWRRWCIENNCGMDPNKFLQEYPSNDVDCFLVSGRPVFDPMTLKRRLMACVDPVAIGNMRLDGSRVMLDSNKRGFVKMWKPPLLGHRYLIAADVAEGVEGGDFSCGHVLDWDEDEQVAEWWGQTHPDEFGKQLAMLGKIYNMALIAVEANKDGGTVNTRLRNDGYPHLFYRQELEHRTNSKRARLGWLTSSTTKPLLVNSLYTALRGGFVTKDKDLIGECMTFVHQKDGTMGAQSGCFDDRVIAAGIAQEVRKRHGLGAIYSSLNEGSQKGNGEDQAA